MEDGNVGEYYGIGRSFKRGAEVGALKKGVPEPVIIAMNWWRNIEWAKGTHPRFSMLEHYYDIVLMLDTIFQFSRPM